MNCLFICDSALKGDLLLQYKYALRKEKYKFSFLSRSWKKTISFDHLLFGRIGIITIKISNFSEIKLHLDKLSTINNTFNVCHFMGFTYNNSLLNETLWNYLTDTLETHSLTYKLLCCYVWLIHSFLVFLMKQKIIFYLVIIFSVRNNAFYLI